MARTGEVADLLYENKMCRFAQVSNFILANVTNGSCTALEQIFVGVRVKRAIS